MSKGRKQNAAPPLISSNGSHRIPKIVWQTNFTDRVTVPVYLNYCFNRLMAPTFEFRFLTDDDIRTFIFSIYPGRIADLYSKLQIGAARADLWRLLVLQAYGGVYLDVDAHFVWPLEWIVGNRVV